MSPVHQRVMHLLHPRTFSPRTSSTEVHDITAMPRAQHTYSNLEYELAYLLSNADFDDLAHAQTDDPACKKWFSRFCDERHDSDVGLRRSTLQRYNKTLRRSLPARDVHGDAQWLPATHYTDLHGAGDVLDALPRPQRGFALAATSASTTTR